MKVICNIISKQLQYLLTLKCAIAVIFSSKFHSGISRASMIQHCWMAHTGEELVTGFAQVSKFMAYNFLNKHILFKGVTRC